LFYGNGGSKFRESRVNRREDQGCSESIAHPGERISRPALLSACRAVANHREGFADIVRGGTAADNQRPLVSRRAVLRYPAKAELLVYNLDLLIDYLPGEPVDGYMHPIPLFAGHHKSVGQTCSIRRITAALRDYIN